MLEGKLPQHEMVLEGVDEAGVEEWYCPACGRRFLMQWPPEYRKVILENGNINAIHMGSKNPEAGTHQRADEAVSEAEAAALANWEELLASFDFESLWKKAL